MWMIITGGVIVIVIISLVLGWSVRRGVDRKAQEEVDPELRKEYYEISRKIDDGQGASHGFFM
jgi:hypothetical protein